jgi:anti-sigma B factor antagonist
MTNELKEGILIVHLEGTLLGVQANSVVTPMILQNIEAGNKKVVFNLGDTKYIDSAGLGMLLNAVTKIKNAGGLLALCSLPEQVRKLLKTTKVESVFNIMADEPSAIEFLKSK